MAIILESGCEKESMKVKRGILSGLLCAVIFCFLVPCIVFAEDGTSNPGTVTNGTLNGILDLTGLSADVTTETLDSEGNGYIWNPNSHVLTLKNIHIAGTAPAGDPSGPACTLIVPSGETVTIKTEGGSSVLDGDINASDISQGALDLVFDNAALTINGRVSSGANNDRVTVQGGSNIEMTGSFYLGAAGIDSYLSIIGAGSTLTSRGGITVAHLEIKEGGNLTASNVVSIQSVLGTTPQNMGSIYMDPSSVIHITAAPTLVSADVTGSTEETLPGANAALQGVLEGINEYLPAGYHIGFGTGTDGVIYCTILDSDDQIAGDLTLKAQPTDDPDEGHDPSEGTDQPEQPDPPKEPEPSKPTKPTRPTRPDHKPGSGGSGNLPGNSDVGSSSQSQNTGVQASSGSGSPENGLQAGASAISPRTGEHAAPEFRFFCILGFLVVLCLAAGLYKAKRIFHR